jgi:PEGA domain
MSRSPAQWMAFLLFGVAHFSLYGADLEAGSITVWIKPFVNNTSDSSYNAITNELARKLRDDPLFKRAAIVPVISDFMQSFAVKISGTVGTGNNGAVFTATLDNSAGKRIWEVAFDLASVERDAMLETVQKKTSFYLEKSALSRLTVSSNPSGCTLIVNGASVGPTPVEVQLTNGSQAIELRRRSFKTLRDTINLQPSEAADIHLDMKFTGAPARPSLFLSCFISLGTIIASVHENSAHQSYNTVAAHSPQSLFDARFKAWQTLNAVRNSLFVLSGVSWTITGALFYKNKRILKNAYSF